MTIDLITIGKTDSEAVATILQDYFRRINRYVKFSVITIPDIKNPKGLNPSMRNKQEGEQILKQIAPGDLLVLLDEKGKDFRSVEFAAWLQKTMAGGAKRLVFIIGGPYGFSEEVYRRANGAISLSRMTFSHQIVRAIFMEQLYRAFTILGNEPYHHE